VSAAGRSRRTWGWHRLDDDWAARIVAAAGIRPGDLVLDIGAGEGALTAHLVRAGARVIAVELHPGRARALRERFPGVTVVRADVAELRLPRRPFRVVANPPFSATAELLRLLLARDSELTAADLGGALGWRRKEAERVLDDVADSCDAGGFRIWAAP